MINNDQILTNPRVACIGKAMIELSLMDLVEQTGRVSGGRVSVAGDAYNTSVYLAHELG